MLYSFERMFSVIPVREVGVRYMKCQGGLSTLKNRCAKHLK